jgi:predicted ATPase
MTETINSLDHCPQGSEWRRWDLHVHTPMSIYSKYGAPSEDVWERFINDLNALPEDFAVLGINDYMFIDGYEYLRDRQRRDVRLQRFRLLPVVEFRIDKFAGVQFGPYKRINLHVVFSDLIETSTIKSQFLNTLDQSYKIESNGETWSRSIDRNSVEELGREIKRSIPESELHKYADDLTEGFNNLNLPEERIYESLKKDCFAGKHLVAVGKTEWSELRWSDASIATKKSILNRADLVFTASESIDAYSKAKSQLTAQLVNDVLLDCSDSHNYSSSSDKDRIGNCFTWIKADPTFEGLKQVVFEPAERLRVQTCNPALDFAKPYFSSIRFDNDIIVFTDDEEPRFVCRHEPLPLNQNLVAIIGGRGEGKSILTDYLSSSFAGQKKSKHDLYQKNGAISVEYQKTNQDLTESVQFVLDDTEHSVDFLYISQGKLKNLVEQRDRKTSIADSIQKLAKLDKPQFSESLNTEAIKSIAALLEIELFLSQQDDDGNLVNSLEYLQDQERSCLSFIENITTKENQEKLVRYSQNLERESSLSKDKVNAAQFVDYLESTSSQINEQIHNLNLKGAEIPQLDKSVFSSQTVAIGKWILGLDESLSAVKQAIDTVREEFKDYKGDIGTLLADVGKFQDSLLSIRQRIQITKENIERRTTTTQTLLQDMTDKPSIVSQIKHEYGRQKVALETEWVRFRQVEQRTDLNEAQKAIMNQLLSDLSIEVVIDFDVDRFYQMLSGTINGTVWRAKNNRQAQIDRFRIESLDTFFDFLRERFADYSGDNSYIQKDFRALFFDESNRSEFIRVIPTLLYKGKNLEKISVGQKGTVYLKMMLATEAFSKPIIFDQPEDDLDNEFIMSELVELFKNLKRYRQVIVITHNANLVVNADAEQVIVAKNSQGSLSYASGSLEDSSINEAICRILEGGQDAFRKRRNRYRNLR